MKQLLLTALLISGGFYNSFAQDGYTIKLKFTDLKDQKVFLAHYYGKPLPTIYKVDSALVDKNGNATLQTKNKIIGGLYILILQDNSRYFEFLLDNGKSLEIGATAEKLPLSVTFKNSPENERFIKYVSFLNEVGEQHQKLTAELAKSLSKKDSAAIQEKFRALSVDVSTFRKNYINQYPGTLLTSIFRALEPPVIPVVNKPDGTQDTEQWYRDYKNSYWDNVAFDDERLVYTPLLGTKLEEYFTKLVITMPDSFNADADMVISKARASKEVFKYVVHWLTTHVQESDIMGMDAAFVHLVETYYMRGEAFWLNQGTLDKYIDRARSIAPNVIGNVAPELKMKKIDGSDVSLRGVNAKYTLLVFWSPDCGHCVDEVPRVDSAIKAAGLDKKGLKVIGFNIDKETDKWKKVIKDKKLDNWIHVHDPERTSDFRKHYDVYGTPSIYLLDEKKIIRGKKLDHNNMVIVVDILEGNTASKK